ncbi:MAG: Hsp20/alpha crystallin family protein [Phycisphaerae bacterium]|nr:Hsp20/alpha crystallin family protein [Phycisphaerae bacterium]
MSRWKFNPAGSLDELRQEVDRLCESYLGGFRPGSLIPGRKFPPLDLWEDGESIVVQAELPGVCTDNVEINLLGNTLTLKGFRPPAAATGATVHRKEQQTGNFERAVTLPTEVDPDRIEATLKDGLLTVTIRKSEVIAARKVAVQPL